MEAKLGYIKGMQQDVSPVLRDPNSYFTGMNIRVITDEGSTTGSVTNDYGNTLLFRLPSLFKAYLIENITSSISVTITGTGTDTFSESTNDDLYNAIIADPDIQTDIAAGKLKVYNIYNGIKIIPLSSDVTVNISGTSPTLLYPSNTVPVIVGSTEIRDSLILFTAHPTISGYGQIWKLDYDFNNNTIENLGSGSYLIPSMHLVYMERLGLTKDVRIGDVMSKYYNSQYGKIYWSVDKLRHLNIYDPNCLGTELSLTEILPNVVLTAPEYKGLLDSGSYKAGMVQYAYQLYNFSGAETLMSATTPLIHLVSDPASSATTSNYRGDPIETNTNKAVRIGVSGLNSNFQFIKLWAVHYSLIGTPIINLVYDGGYSGSTFEYIDTGNVSIGTLTQEEFASFGGEVFNANTLTVKNNYLIAGNIEDERFDIDDVFPLDTRAYRFNSSNQFKIDSTVYDFTDINSIESDANCLFEDSYYTDYKYKAYSSGAVLGGSGPRISYEIKVESYTIDINGGINTEYLTPTELKSNNNYEFIGYSSPYDSGYKVGYTWGEFYRFGIEFIDPKGRRSFTKWIADIKMPLPNESVLGITKLYNYSIVTNKVTTYRPYIEFTLNLPTELKGYSYRIMRVKREDYDKSILAFAYIKGIVQADSSLDNTYRPLGILAINNSTTTQISNHYIGISPEFSFKNIVNPPFSGSTFIKIGRSSNTSGWNTTTVYASVLEDNILYPLTSEPTFSSLIFARASHTFSKVKEVSMISSSSTSIIDQSILGVSKVNTIGLSGDTTALKNLLTNPDLDEDYSTGGRGLYFKTSSSLYEDDYLSFGVFTINRDFSRYGGTLYASRTLNSYIPCNSPKLITSGINTSAVYGGDCYNQYFDWQEGHTITPNGEDESEHWVRTCFLPIPSTINTALRGDTCTSRTTVANQVWKLQDSKSEGVSLFAETEEYSTGEYPSSYTDMYVFNPVYNIENTTVRGFPKPLNFISESKADFRIRCSQPSIANEVVDKWLKFLPNDVLDLNSKYGAINKLVVSNNRLIALQDTATAVVGFKDRQLLSEGAATLVLGDGGILGYHDYVSTNTGCRHRESVVSLDSNIMWYDANTQKIIRLGDGLEIMSDTKNMISYFKNFPKRPDSFVLGYYSKTNNRVYFNTNNYNIAYNLLLGQFESEFSYTPWLWIPSELGLVSLHNTTIRDRAYMEDKTIYTTYYGLAQQFYIKHIFGEPVNKKVFTNIEVNINSDSDKIPSLLGLSNSYTSTLGEFTSINTSNFKRRFRTYRYQLPRMQGGDRQRFIDYYIGVDIRFNQSNEAVRLDDITLKYMIPMI